MICDTKTGASYSRKVAGCQAIGQIGIFVAFSRPEQACLRALFKKLIRRQRRPFRHKTGQFSRSLFDCVPGRSTSSIARARRSRRTPPASAPVIQTCAPSASSSPNKRCAPRRIEMRDDFVEQQKRRDAGHLGNQIAHARARGRSAAPSVRRSRHRRAGDVLRRIADDEDR